MSISSSAITFVFVHSFIRFAYVEDIVYDERFKNQSFIPVNSIQSLKQNFKIILRHLRRLHRNLTISDTPGYMNNCSG
uniref:Secreted protein n=1 Tax=Steinernema glaseri TaxID=37863 RepID=A0A1I7ZFY0_9BILA